MKTNIIIFFISFSHLLSAQYFGYDPLSRQLQLFSPSDSVPLIHFRNTSTTADWFLKHDGTKFHIQNEAAPGNEKWTILSNGMVGIGTVSPTKKLEVNGEFLATDKDKIATFHSSGINSFISFENNGVPTGGDFGYFNDNTKKYFFMNTPSGNFGEFTVWDNGSVGIGMGDTALPNYAGIVLGGKNFHIGSDDAVMMTDPGQLSSDFWLLSNDDIVFRLDNNDDESGHLVIQNADGEGVLRVDEEGQLEIWGKSNRPAGGGSDDAVVTSDPTQPGSDLFLVSNDAVIVELDDDNDDLSSSFRILDELDRLLFTFDSNANLEIYSQRLGELKILDLDWFTGDLSIFGSLTENSCSECIENILPIDNQKVLQSLMKIPVYEWSYKGHTKRHLGPVAEEFHSAISMGEDPSVISNIDARGVLIASLQAQQEIIEKQQSEIDHLKKDMESIKLVLAGLDLDED